MRMPLQQVKRTIQKERYIKMVGNPAQNSRSIVAYLNCKCSCLKEVQQILFLVLSKVNKIRQERNTLKVYYDKKISDLISKNHIQQREHQKIIAENQQTIKKLKKELQNMKRGLNLTFRAGNATIQQYIFGEEQNSGQQLKKEGELCLIEETPIKYNSKMRGKVSVNGNSSIGQKKERQQTDLLMSAELVKFPLKNQDESDFEQNLLQSYQSWQNEQHLIQNEQNYQISSFNRKQLKQILKKYNLTESQRKKIMYQFEYEYGDIIRKQEYQCQDHQRLFELGNKMTLSLILKKIDQFAQNIKNNKNQSNHKIQ